MATSFSVRENFMSVNTLTVDNQWKVDKCIADRLSRQSGPSKLVPVAKWAITIFLGTVITCIFVSTKLSFISLARFLNSVKPDPKQFIHEEWVHYTGHFLLIYLTIAVPYFLLFLRATWTGLFHRTVVWPTKTAIALCIFVGVLEPFGLVLLALKVLPNMSPTLGAFTMSSFIVFSVVGKTIHSFRNRSSYIFKLFNVVSLILLCGAVGLLIYMVVDTDGVSKTLWHLPVCIVTLNIAWLPWLQKRLTEQNTRVAGADCSDSDTNNLGTEQTSTTWKSSFIIYGMKNISTFLFCFIFFYLDTDYPVVFTQEMHSAFLSAWDFEKSIRDLDVWINFGVNVAGGLIGYVLVAVACHTNMQRGCLAVPLVLSLPLSVLVIKVHELCHDFMDDNVFCEFNDSKIVLTVIEALIFTLGHMLSIGRHSFKKELVYLQKERELFWIPGYNGAVLDFYLLLNRKQTIQVTSRPRASHLRSTKTRVYICTTMYREDKDEMKQLLESLARVNLAQQEGETYFESHIFFDGGVHNNKLSEFPLILISLLEETLGVKPEACTKVTTPYGLKLSWGLPTHMDKDRMTFSIHLKDNMLVKNKKRWSQVMYMSYVLDFVKDSGVSVESYILTTDADVMFTPDSVEALLDLMTRDSTIGAVCARTHPMGSGPLVWYQIFEYAVGHWFQKASEHVLGSVLCAPGCFSVYRCRALSDVLPKYCKKVESAFDFLTKDMGEDRWLCTLMLQSGWRIEYCAASENSTNCPAEFEEFYKQRRRWVASTLANLMLIIKEWKYIALFNHRLTFVFLCYQALLLFSTLIAPSMVILVVAGGLQYAWDVDVLSMIILQVIMCIIYTCVCLYTSQDTQMLVSKLYTFIYAIAMCAAVVGTAEQIVVDISGGSANDPSPSPPPNVSHDHMLTLVTTKRPNQHISINLPVSVTTIYLAFLVGVFLLGGILHPREFTCLLHGTWYLLCLPSAYLVLILYSICNLTDSSWGTREETKITFGYKTNWWSTLNTNWLKKIFFCCKDKSKPPGVSVGVQTQSSFIQQTSGAAYGSENVSRANSIIDGDFLSSEDFVDNDFDTGDLKQVEDIPLDVDQWLPPELSAVYSSVLKKHGYENTLFIKGLTESDLLQMGVKRKGHVQYLLSLINSLPAFAIEYKVPNNVDDWLDEIGLSMYREKFYKNKIKTLKEMEILKSFNTKTIVDQLEIKKQGHIKRLMYAIRMLKDPLEDQKKAIKMRLLIDEVDLKDLKICNIGEFDFWESLRSKCLEPDLKAFGMEAEIKEKLIGLRNNWLMTIAVANTLWLILLSTIASKGNLTVIGANPIGLVFLLIFGLLFLIQFLAMIVHRVSTLCHYIARAPYTFGNRLLTTWSFQDKFDNYVIFSDDAEDVASESRDGYVGRSNHRHINERTPLLTERAPLSEVV